ncbi:MAG: Slp family lipoprotein [Gammaproteobacteria bacterium]|nr:Slp family lipoprotein [Gammaproteobacteria bacterium]
MINPRILLLPLLSLLVIGCASTPVFDTRQVDTGLTPQQVIDTPSANIGDPVLWGGIILNTRNLGADSLVEVLAFPLDSAQRPKTGTRALGRFMIRYQGLLEPTAYSQGRRLTVLGEIKEIQQLRDGDSDSPQPVVLSQQLQLWPAQDDYRRGGFQFGIGISIHN